MKPAMHHRARRWLKFVGILVIAVAVAPIALMTVLAAIQGQRR